MLNTFPSPQGESILNKELMGLPTPCLLLDQNRMENNIRRLGKRLSRAGVGFRPHLKTAKSIEVARRMVDGANGPATVSTLREAEEFAAAGITDLTYAVGISPCKLSRVLSLRDQGVDLSIILDSTEQAEAVAAASPANNPIPVLIEIDCDGHRSGVAPENCELMLAIANRLEPSASLHGILTHAGESYSAHNTRELVEAAKNERKSTVAAAIFMRAQGFACPVVSVGSTPTAHFAPTYKGVTEVRAGAFVFFDLVQAGIGVCTLDDIAISVLTTVIGHQREKEWIIIDAGWTALSSDRGTVDQSVDQGYGVVCDMAGRPISGLNVVNVNQEHGVIAKRSSSSGPVPDLPIGTRLRILPNHACATADQFEKYHVITPNKDGIIAEWPRFRGW
ncbi:alanine racemase [uncultured Pseudodesulfovibrio sp.]|uniref:alanine racemase n=1 Tax=uncultured Pseudodesulfovibrio sp. TaxID=2035858 RepID=UPI0029C6D61D|nr:alanine racemase [uncultured Pseudodesulfovibrio sp.]